ncbi:MAG: isoprenylcysteine carboxylmethyltransferase family protein [Opitutales bacterium]|nr:isoprenylcysteine carboxylmethyltransferase family protein [Opitutales bacterium]
MKRPDPVGSGNAKTFRLHRLPPFWFLFAVGAQFTLAWRAGPDATDPLPFGGWIPQIIGWGLLLGGVAFVLWAAHRFHRWQTPIHPFQEPTNLITDGPFRISRNPIYLGQLLMLLGLACMFRVAVAFLPVLLFVPLVQILFILPEERILRERFGEVFETYGRRTRRWI